MEKLMLLSPLVSKKLFETNVIIKINNNLFDGNSVYSWYLRLPFECLNERNKKKMDTNINDRDGKKEKS